MVWKILIAEYVEMQNCFIGLTFLHAYTQVECMHIMCSLVNHTTQPMEESLAKMRTSSRAELSMKIVDNQLDAWLRSRVNACERIQVQLTKLRRVGATSQLCNNRVIATEAKR